MYNNYFGFRRSPFNLTPNPDFFYANSVYLEAHANLRYGIESKKGFIALTGEVGTGKTTLLRKVMRDLRPTTRFAFVFNTSLAFEDLLQIILHDLGLTTRASDKVTMLRQLNDFLVEQYEKGFPVCLLIDEAQNLTDQSLEELRLLSNFETDEEKLLQIVLIGQPELKTKLDHPSLRQLKERIAVRCEIFPLWRQEVGRYVDFRLRTAGYQGGDLFTAAALHEIAVQSKGIPRLINVLCDNALLLAFAAERKMVSVDLIREAARDLRLLPEPDSPAAAVARAHDTRADAAVSEWPLIPVQGPARGRGRVAAGVFLLVIVFVAGTYVEDVRRFLVMSGRSFELVAPDVTQERLLVPRQEPTRQDVQPEVAIGPAPREQTGLMRNDETIIVRYGSTIYEIALAKYGANAIVGMDLISEFNPRLTNLNSVAAGQELVLPGLTPESLARRHADGSYRLLLASFVGRRDADELARRIQRSGYRTVVTPRRVANDLLLLRVEIAELKSPEEAAATLQGALRQGWISR